MGWVDSDEENLVRIIRTKEAPNEKSTGPDEKTMEGYVWASEELESCGCRPALARTSSTQVSVLIPRPFNVPAGGRNLNVASRVAHPTLTCFSLKSLYCSHIFPVSPIAELQIELKMKLATLFLITLAGVSAKKEDELPELAFLKHVALSDSKICADGEVISVSCNLNIMELIPVVVEDKKNPNRLRRRLKKEDDEKPIYSSAEYGLEVSNCTDTIKGFNSTANPKILGRELVAEVEGFRNYGVSFDDADENAESYMVRQGRIMFYEPPTDAMLLLGYTKSDHVGNLLFKLVIERKEIVDERELWIGMTLTMQAMADSIMMNDTGVVFADLEPTYKKSTKIISAELEWEDIINSPCSPHEYATATHSPTDGPTGSPTPDPSVDPSPYPTPSPSADPTSDPITPTGIPTPSPTEDPDALDALDFFTRPYPGVDARAPPRDDP
jgi:hypothetical protein